MKQISPIQTIAETVSETEQTLHLPHRRQRGFELTADHDPVDDETDNLVKTKPACQPDGEDLLAATHLRRNGKGFI